MAHSWFYVEGKQKVGPVNQELIINYIQGNQLNGESYVWRKGFENWTKVKEVPELKMFLGKKGMFDEEEIGEEEENDPGEKFITMKRSPKGEPSRKANKEIDWANIGMEERIFTIKQNENGNIYGPFSVNMLEKLFSENRISGKSLIFTPGMDNWEFLADLPIYKEVFVGNPAKIDDKERRKNKRRPFVARMFFHDDTQLFEGVCRDISIGGMQVLVSSFPGKKGDTINLNVHPENSDQHFVASGRIGRILDGDQGVFILFNELGEDAKNAINSFVDAE